MKRVLVAGFLFLALMFSIGVIAQDAQDILRDVGGGEDKLIDLDPGEEGDGKPDCIAHDGIHCDTCIHGVFEDGQCKKSGDLNLDGEVNECDKKFNEDKTQGPMFMRGDTTGDLKIDVSDAVSTLNYLFLGGEVGCQDAADINNDGKIDVTDAIYTLSFLFSGGDPPQVVSSSWYACEGDGVKDRCLSIPPDDPDEINELIKWDTCLNTNFDPIDADGKPTLEDCNNLGNQCQCMWKYWGNELPPIWCDIYGEKKDDLTCEIGIKKQVTTEESCDPERKDENKDGKRNDNCPDLPPQAYIMAPPLLDIMAPASMPQTDYGLKLLDLSRDYDLTELNVMLISGKEGIDRENIALKIDPLRSPKVEGFFTLKPSLDELNVQGITPASITGSVIFWEDFKNKNENFPPNMVHTMRFTLSDQDSGGNIRSSFIELPWRYAVEESGEPGAIWQGDQNVPAGSTDGAGVRVYDQSADKCACSGIELYYQRVQCTDENTCHVSKNLPFPPASFYVEGFNIDNKGQKGPFTLRTFDGAMEVLGDSPLSFNGLLQSIPQIYARKDLSGNPMDEYGVGDVTGIIPLPSALSSELKQRSGKEGIFYHYPVVYDGFHYQVKAKTNGNCPLTEFMQSNTIIGKDVKYLACDEWRSSLNQWPPTTEDMKKPVRHDYVSASQVDGKKAAGVGFDYSCPNGFTPQDRYAPSWGYTDDAGESPLGVYFENIVKKETDTGPVLQNTLMHMRNQDPQRSTIYRIIDIVGLPDQGTIDSPGVKCGCTMDLMYSDGSWQVIKDPKCEVYDSPGR